MAEPATLYYPRCYAVLQLLLDGMGPDDGETLNDSEIEIPVLPKSATIHCNSYKQADSFELTFDGRDLPIDPEAIRAGAVSIYLFQTRALAQDSFAVAEPTDVDSGVTMKPRISGLFDEPELQTSAQGKFVTIRGQDYTAFLASKQWPPMPDRTARRMPVGKRLDDTLREILAMADPGNFLDLDVDPGLTPVPLVEAHVNAHDRGIPVEEKTSYWDVMYKLADRCGAVLYVRGNSVVLSAPHNLDAKDQSRIRRLAWGANLESLQFTRRMGRVIAPTVVMRGVDIKGHIVEVQYPSAARRVPHHDKKQKTVTKVQDARSIERIKGKKPTPEGSHKAKKPSLKALVENRRDEYEFVPAGPIDDPAVLEQMAEVRYRVKSHGERRVVAKTAHLRDFLGADMLSVNSGDAVTIDFADVHDEVIGNDSIAPAVRIGYLVNRGYRPEVASMLVTYHDRVAALRRPLRVKEATYSYSCDKGVAIELDLESFMQLDEAHGLFHDITEGVARFNAYAKSVLPGLR